MKAVAIVCFILLPVLALGQLSKEQVEKLITNGHNRSWAFNNYIQTKGIKCIGEWQLFTFRSDGNVELKRCLNGVIDMHEMKWEVQPVGKVGSGEWQLLLSEAVTLKPNQAIQIVRIDLPLAQPGKKGQQMIWRVVAECLSCFETRINLTSTN